MVQPKRVLVEACTLHSGRLKWCHVTAAEPTRSCGAGTKAARETAPAPAAIFQCITWNPSFSPALIPILSSRPRKGKRRLFRFYAVNAAPPRPAPRRHAKFMNAAYNAGARIFPPRSISSFLRHKGLSQNPRELSKASSYMDNKAHGKSKLCAFFHDIFRTRPPPPNA